MNYDHSAYRANHSDGANDGHGADHWPNDGDRPNDDRTNYDRRAGTEDDYAGRRRWKDRAHYRNRNYGNSDANVDAYLGVGGCGRQRKDGEDRW